MKDLQDNVYELTANDVRLEAMEHPSIPRPPPVSHSSTMLDVFAELATNLLRERQLEGIAAATVRGVYKERKQLSLHAEVRR